jgi:putative holliday junction resolvase
MRPSSIVLGFDYGESRTGVAVGQMVTGTATPLTNLQRRADGLDWTAINALIQAWKPAAIVVGLPVAEYVGARAIKASIAGFRRELTARFGLPVYTVNEAYSSVEAYQRLKTRRAQRDGKRIHKGEIDAMAAAILLEAWMSNAHPNLTERTTI